MKTGEHYPGEQHDLVRQVAALIDGGSIDGKLLQRARRALLRPTWRTAELRGIVLAAQRTAISVKRRGFIEGRCCRIASCRTESR